MLPIAVGYVDPGKWAAMVDGGARFGHASTLVQFCCHLCWYLSAWIALGTDQDLAQVVFFHCNLTFDCV